MLFLAGESAKKSKNEPCKPPHGCEFSNIHDLDTLWANEFLSQNDIKGIKCEIKNKNFEFNFLKWKSDNGYSEESNNLTCTWPIDFSYFFIELKWPTHQSITFERSVNISNLINIINSVHFNYVLRMTNLKAIDANLFDIQDDKIIEKTSRHEIEFINTRFSFYIDGKRTSSCQDFNKSNLLTPRSIFQIRSNYGVDQVLFANSDFKDVLCPLVFKNAKISSLLITGMFNLFFKKNVLSFSKSPQNSTYLNSAIYSITMFRTQQIDLDLNFLNPEVFRELNSIYSYGHLNSIDKSLFLYLRNVDYLQIEAQFTRRMMHKGVEWINNINNNIKVNLSNLDEIDSHFDSRKYVKIRFLRDQTIYQVFPDKDFCLYKDFPFDQLVMIVQYFENEEKFQFTCTFLWLIRYYSTFVKIYSKHSSTGNLMRETLKYKPSDCNFDHLLILCDKNKYEIKALWDKSDTYQLSFKFITAITIMSYIVSLLGITSNSIVIYIISSKKNSDLFKGIKQYNYLRLVSVYSIIMLIIQLLSWMSECAKTYDAFCPEIRKYVAIQFFKVIFKESFVTALRFMSNFAYVAFALNRISLIGKSHGSIVRFFSEVNIKTYTIVTSLISIALSVVKGFRYKINYDHSEQSYPIQFEQDIWFKFSWDRDAYVIVNCICDILNYVVFVAIHIGIDIFLVVKLKNTINQKLVSATFPKAVDEKKIKKKENEDSVNQAIKMVVLNTTLSTLLKLLLSFIPFVNVIAEFYFKSSFKDNHPRFGSFYGRINILGIYEMIPVLADFLFTVFISVQLFVFIKFDRKIKLGLDRCFIIKNQKQNQNSKLF